MAGIDNNTVLYLRGDSFNDLSLNPKNIVSGETVISDNAYYINSNKLPIKVDDVNFGDTWTVDFFAHKNGEISTNILSKGYYTAGVNGGFTLRIINPSSGRNGLELWTSNGTTLSYPFQNTQIYFNDTFDHYAFTYDGTKMNIFINGKFIKSFTLSFNFNQNNSPLIIGRDGYTTASDSICIKHFRLSDTVLYTQDFTPPTKAYSSIGINISNKDSNKIDFNISKSGQEDINKVEVLVNDVISKTYEDIGDLTYNIDNDLCGIGKNNITIRVTYDNGYVEEEILTHNYRPNELDNSSKLNDVIDRYEFLNNATGKINQQLADILIHKNVEVKEDEYKLGALIDKIDLLKEKVNTLYLYNEGDEFVDITGGWKGHQWDSSFTKGYYSKQSNYLEYGDNSNNYGYGGFITATGVDLTPYSTLIVKHQMVSTSNEGYGAYAQVCLSQVPSPSIRNNGQVIYLTAINNSITTKEEIIDITNYNGIYYLGVQGQSGTYHNHTVVNRLHYMYLET